MIQLHAATKSTVMLLLDEEPEPEIDISALMERQRLDDAKEGAIGVSVPEEDDDVGLPNCRLFLKDSIRILPIG